VMTTRSMFLGRDFGAPGARKPAISAEKWLNQ